MDRRQSTQPLPGMNVTVIIYHNLVHTAYLCSLCPRGGAPGYNEINDWSTNSLYEDCKHQRRKERYNSPHSKSCLRIEK